MRCVQGATEEWLCDGRFPSLLPSVRREEVTTTAKNLEGANIFDWNKKRNFHVVNYMKIA